MKLPALLLSKIVVPESFRGPSFRRGILLAEDLGSLPRYPQKRSHKKQKTGAERRAQSLMRSDSARCSTFLSRANKAPHYRICTLEYFRPDCESPARPGSFGKCRTICNHTITSVDVKRRTTLFFGAFHTPVEAVKITVNAVYSASTVHSLRLRQRIRPSRT